jgi:hypothetical protein
MEKGIKGAVCTTALVIKSVTMGGGDVKNGQKLCDVIYGLFLSSFSTFLSYISAIQKQ